MELYYERLEQNKDAHEAMEPREYPEEVHRKYLEQLKPEQGIFEYISIPDMVYFRLVYTGHDFELRSFQGRRLYEDPALEDFSPLRAYEDIAAFWNEFTEQSNWYEAYGHSWEKHPCMAKFITTSANRIREQGDFSHAGYELLSDWENIIGVEDFDPAVHHQFCAHCRERVYFQARYPKYICGSCRGLITDKDGRRVDYYNTEMMGHGCAGYYVDTDEPYESAICFIGTAEYAAEEAYFGGIEIQARDELEEASFPGAGYMRFREKRPGPLRKYLERVEYETYINALQPGSFPSHWEDEPSPPEIGHCAHCRRRIVLLSVSHVLCGACRNQVTDVNGRPVRFERVRVRSGIQGFFRDTGEFYFSRDCFLGGRAYRVQEFGKMYFQLMGAE